MTVSVAGVASVRPPAAPTAHATAYVPAVAGGRPEAVRVPPGAGVTENVVGGAGAAVAVALPAPLAAPPMMRPRASLTTQVTATSPPAATEAGRTLVSMLAGPAFSTMTDAGDSSP